MQTTDVPWIWIAAAAGGIGLLWLAAGWTLHRLDRRLDRTLGPRGARDRAARRARVTRPFESDTEAPAATGRVRIGVEIWSARCAAPLAGELRVGDRVWVRPEAARHMTVLGRAAPPGTIRDDERNRRWTTDTSS